ncbi:MAG: hypothetical protein O2887_11580 [Bacteroidetes bacterium]|nr:hypothetical protein [Bacteroidota bacterium]MDA1121111.1 hypothetical protein [Bacteroidota bacterium]
MSPLKLPKIENTEDETLIISTQDNDISQQKDMQRIYRFSGFNVSVGRVSFTNNTGYMDMGNMECVP